MKRWEVVELAAPIIATARQKGVKDEDIERIGLFHEVMRRRREGEKMEAIAYDIKTRIGLSRSAFFQFVNRMTQEV